MATLSQLAQAVCNRIEETDPPVFWNLQGEIYQFLVEAMNEAALITGEPQMQQVSDFTLAAGTSIFSTPATYIALLRIQAPNWVMKTSLWDLDRNLPGWESDYGPTPKYWYPIGLNQFGVYPLLLNPVNVTLTGVQLPINTGVPYTGNEVVPFQTEYLDGFEDYAAHVCGLKEGGQDFKSSAKVYDRFIQTMMEMSNFAYRKGSLRFTRTVGPTAQVTPVEKR